MKGPPRGPASPSGRRSGRDGAISAAPPRCDLVVRTLTVSAAGHLSRRICLKPHAQSSGLSSRARRRRVEPSAIRSCRATAVIRAGRVEGGGGGPRASVSTIAPLDDQRGSSSVGRDRGGRPRPSPVEVTCVPSRFRPPLAEPGRCATACRFRFVVRGAEPVHAFDAPFYTPSSRRGAGGRAAVVAPAWRDQASTAGTQRCHRSLAASRVVDDPAVPAAVKHSRCAHDRWNNGWAGRVTRPTVAERQSCRLRAIGWADTRWTRGAQHLRACRVDHGRVAGSARGSRCRVDPPAARRR